MLKIDTTKAYHSHHHRQQDINDINTTATTTNASAPSSQSSSDHGSLLQQKIQLSDEKVQLYIQSLFEVSSRSITGTAPAYEWLQLLDLYNEREGHYILTNAQKNAIRPYCQSNQNVEMTPEDFVRLLCLVRSEKWALQQQQQQQQQPQQPRQSVSTPLTTQTKKLFDSARPRSSRLMNNKKSLNSYYDDGASVNHPDHVDKNNDISNMNKNNPMMMLRIGTGKRGGESGDPIETDELLKVLKKEKILATRQLKEYENRVNSMSKEHLERISQLQTRLEFMKIELENQKNLSSQQKNKERERLDKIAELQALLNDQDNKVALAHKKHQKRQEEYEKLQDTQHTLQHNLNSLENELAVTREQIRILEKEKMELVTRLESEKRLTSELRVVLREEQDKNTKLMEIIDRQKFDLDEARSAGLRYYTNSPTAAPATAASMDKKSLGSTASSSLAQEQMETEYMKKLTELEKERDEYQIKLVEKEQELLNVTVKLNAATTSQHQDKLTIAGLSAQFDHEHQLMESIKSNILSQKSQQQTVSSNVIAPQLPPTTTTIKNKYSKLTKIFTAITYTFFFYHAFMILINSLYFGNENVNFLNPYIFILQQLDEWITAHLSS